MKHILYPVVLVAAAACASIQPYGPDTYSSDALRPLVAARRFCAARGKRVDPVAQVQDRYAAAHFVFRCVP